MLFFALLLSGCVTPKCPCDKKLKELEQRLDMLERDMTLIESSPKDYDRKWER